MVRTPERCASDGTAPGERPGAVSCQPGRTPAADSSAGALDLLNEPRVAVRVVERHERAVVAALGVRAGLLSAVRKVERLAHPDTPTGEVGARVIDVRDNEVKPLDRAGRLGVAHQRDR